MKMKKIISIPPHQEVPDREVVSSMNSNELFLCSISESVAFRQALRLNITYYKGDAENSRKEERRASSKSFLEWIAQPCPSIVVVRVG